MNTTTVVKLPSLLKLLCISRSLAFKQISEGLLPSGIFLSRRSKGYILEELEVILSARIASQTPEQIKALVKALEAKRLDYL